MRSGMFHTTINDTEIFVTCSINGPCVKLTVSAFFESDLSDICSQMQAMKSEPVLLSMDVYISMDVYKNGTVANISAIGLLSRKEKEDQNMLMQLYRNCCAAMLVLARQKGEEA